MPKNQPKEFSIFMTNQIQDRTKFKPSWKYINMPLYFRGRDASYIAVTLVISTVDVASGSWRLGSELHNKKHCMSQSSQNYHLCECIPSSSHSWCNTWIKRVTEWYELGWQTLISSSVFLSCRSSVFFCHKEIQFSFHQLSLTQQSTQTHQSLALSMTRGTPDSHP